MTSLQQVSHSVREASMAPRTWYNLAYNLMCRGRRLFLHDRLFPTELSANEVRRSVMMTVSAEDNWRRDYPKAVSPSRVVPLGPAVQLDQLSYVMKYGSPRHLVLPTYDGYLLGWDMDRGVSAGRYYMGHQTVLINVQGDYESRSLYWITGKYQEHG